MSLAQLHVGGLVAVGVDPSGRYLLTVSHSGRGVFETQTWQRVARDYELAYPADGQAVGIGPLAGQCLSVREINPNTGTLNDAVFGRFTVSYEDGVVRVNRSAP
ncbi:MAG: hypothetical protein ACTHM6_01810 [Tepidisphaeraceae bacterium]